ncbi:type II toxin-antitoxin system RelE/ParE family toxin [Rickettsiaceae bacterium]|nr:type II toxin-antitoxin system RelE/ParE family toxin [Rickettsiaceae bacterium]
MIYNILYQDEVIKKHIPKLSIAVKSIIKSNIESKLVSDPISFGKPLRYSLKGHRRLRVGDYRIVYRIDAEDVIIIAIKHRKDIY